MSERLEAVLRLTERLLEIPSETGDETAIAEFVAGECGRLGPHSLLRAGNSVACAVRPVDPGKQTLMLLGHTDTVPALGPNPVRRDGGLLYGLGASDMKAAVALILHVLRRAAEQEPRHNVVGVLYATEESSYDRNELPLVHDAARDWFDVTTLAICMEPTDNCIELGCLGTSHAELTFAGKRAHSARPWQGQNAIHAAAGVLGRLAERPPERFECHGLTFVESMSATSITFRGARNVIPDRCVVNVNYRFAPGKDEAAVRAELERLAAGEAAVEVVDFCPSGRVCGDNPLLAELVEAAGRPEVRAKQAWTDVGRLSQLGVDAVNWGPGATSQAHQAGEWVSIADVERGLQALERWLFEARG